MEAFINLLHPDRMPRMTKRWQPQVPYRQDRQLTPAELKLSVLRSERMLALIEEHSQHNERARQQITADMRTILDEIGLGYNMPIIRWSGICLNHILLRICNAVHCNDRAMQQLKAVIGDRPVLYLPSHRSYMDFVIMSYVCFAYDLAIPGIAAGMDFHGMVGVGRLIRQTCAFFMRRSFGEGNGGSSAGATDDSRLYWPVFAEYMHQLVTAYHTGVEFFIEGTRSRSFKALPPKIGLLSMALQPFFAGEVPDVLIVPIGVAYERPLEEQLFAYELLGVPKPKESTMALFRAIKVLDTRHGDLWINFGQPMSAKEWLAASGLDRFGRAQLPAHVQQLNRAELRMVAAIGHEVVVRQQRLIVMTVFNLLAVCCNSRSCAGSGLGELRQLEADVMLLAELLRTLGALVALDDGVDCAEAVRKTLDIHAHLLRAPRDGGDQLELLRPQVSRATTGSGPLKAHQLAAQTLSSALPQLTLQIYANPCMFWLAGPAMVLLAVRQLQQEPCGRIELAAIEGKCTHIRRIFGEEFVLAEEHTDCERVLRILGGWQMFGDMETLSCRPGSRRERLLLSVLVPFLSCYLQVAEALCAWFGGVDAADVAAAAVPEKRVLVAVQQRVEAAIVGRRDEVQPYALSLDSITHALHSFQANGYLEKARCAANKETVYHCAKPERLHALRTELHNWCKLLPNASSTDANFTPTPALSSAVLAKL